MRAPDEPPSLAALGARFELAVLETHAVDRPGDIETLRELAYAYSEAGRHQEALDLDVRLVRMAPQRAELHYDLACSLSLVGSRDAAFESLERAVALGFCRRDFLLADPDFVAIHDDPRWAALVERISE